MRKLGYVCFFFLMMVGQANFAQQGNNPAVGGAKPQPGARQAGSAVGVVKGRVLIKETKQAQDYVNIAVLRQKDSVVVNGGITSEKGYFSVDRIPNGMYKIRVSMIGFNTIQIDSVQISDKTPVLQLGTLYIEPSNVSLKTVDIVAEKSLVEYKLDKRVVNVDKNLVTGGGTATEVLETIPSVAVDNDGNITLRGSSSVRIFIDGRPAELMGSDIQAILEQIPANTIENVEIITNPSAKYDSQGASGIINIKLKENKIRGLNGLAGVDFGSALPRFAPTATTNFSLNYKTQKWIIYGALDGNFRTRASDGFSEIQRFKNYDSLFSHVYQEQENERRFINGSIRMGAEYSFNKYNSLNMSYQYRKNASRGESTIDSRDSLFYRPDYFQKNNYKSGEDNHNINLNYKKTFDRKDQELTLDMSYSLSNGYDFSTQDYTQIDTFYHRKTDAPSKNQFSSILLNYVHPFNEKARLETGFNGFFNRTDNNNRFYLTSPTQNAVFDSLSSKYFIFDENVTAYYANFGYQFTKKLSSQVGLRYEYVFNNANVNQVDYGIKPYGSLFPTIHLSYMIDPNQSVQLSYSRRVRRPSMWFMSPLVDLTNPETIQFGNPNLKAAYTNSLEVSYNKTIKDVNIFTSLFYKETQGMISRYSFRWTEENARRYGFIWNYDNSGRNAITWLNIQQNLNYGMELIADYKISAWWKINASVNLSQTELKGDDNFNIEYTRALLWNAKLNSIMTLPKFWTLQLSGKYNAPWINPQGRMYEMYWVDLAVKKDVMNRRGTINIRVNDLFATLNHRFESDIIEGSYRNLSYSERRRLSPYISVGFSYKISKGERFKQPKGKNYNNEEGGGGMEEF